MLPPTVFAVKALGWAQGVGLLLWRSGSPHPAIGVEEAAGSSLGTPGHLLAYRFACFAWCLALGALQLRRLGPWVLTFATVWNWWLLTLYFGFASTGAHSATASRGPASSSSEAPPADLAATADSMILRSPGATHSTAAAAGGGGKEGATALGGKEGGRLERTQWAVYHVVGPMALVIDIMTWLVLMPMLMTHPDPKQRAVYHVQHHNFESYNMHGVNALMILGELVLNRLPVDFCHSGWLALWASTYAAWSTLHFYWYGRFIYPFLDAHKPYAWLSYLGLYAVHWAAFLAWWALACAKERALGARSAAQRSRLAGVKRD